MRSFGWISVLCVVVYKVDAKTGAEDRNETFKNQHCLDPRTQQRHAAYTEWADAYSCTRHRCQPGTRKLAVYTVGCKQVDPPESAIECEQVVEDTNMQFPYCCTRLRCLVVIRGEVWTKVLGQPWESLPAAPWSHMYKMKRAPPDASNKASGEGPVYELAKMSERESEERGSDEADALRSRHRRTTAPPAHTTPCADWPDIVIAVQTTNSKDEQKKNDESIKRFVLASNRKDSNEIDYVEGIEDFSDEQLALRQRVQQNPAEGMPRPLDAESAMLRVGERGGGGGAARKAEREPERKREKRRMKRPTEDPSYTRFTTKGKGKLLRQAEKSTTSEKPLLVEDNASGYFSDSEIARRVGPVKKPARPVFVAPVETRKSTTENRKRQKKKHRRRSRRRTLRAESRRRRMDRLNSLEMDVASMENSETSLG